MIYFYIFIWLYPSDILYIQVQEADIFWEVQELFSWMPSNSETSNFYICIHVHIYVLQKAKRHLFIH